MRTIALSAQSILTAAAFSNCPLLGPDYPPPQNLKSDQNFQASLINLTQQLDNAVSSQKSTWGPLLPDANFFSAGAFDLASSNLLFHYDWNAPNVPLAPGSKPKTDSDTIYRIGSISKVFTIYTQLVERGTSFWIEPVIKYVPEFAQATANQSLSNPILYPEWQDITIGELASQLAGIGRGDFTPPLGFVPPGLPQVLQPACESQDNCTRSAFFEDVLNYPAIFLPSTTPIYSNMAYQILAWALEGATGKNYTSMLRDDILSPLQLSETSYFTPNSSNGLVLNGSAGGWASSFEINGPAGAIYSTVNDLAKFGRSIMNSTLLSPVETRRWLKPRTHTADSMFSVGAPWEIRRVSVNGHIVDMYNKNGGTGGYASQLCLLPDYNAGFVTLAAGLNASSVVAIVSNFIGETVLPALEEAAQEQALANFGGTYQGSGDNLNSILTVDIDPTLSGLRIRELRSNDVDVLTEFASEAGISGPVDFQLQPSNTKTSSQVSFRAIPLFRSSAVSGGIFPSDCGSWSTIDALRYGNRPIDDFIFEVSEDGQAISITPTTLDIVMKRAQSSL